MANYKELEGFGVQTLAADPDTPGWVGSIFYNSTEGVFKTVKPGGVAVGTWASGGTFSSPIHIMAGAGTQTAAVSVAGYFNPGTPVGESDGVYLYDGTSWSTNPNNYPVATYALWGSGTQTAGLFTGGSSVLSTTNKFNGTTFTGTGGLNSGRRYLASSGTENATIATGGYTTTQVAIVEDFNGSTWTPTTSMNNTRQQHSQIGASTASLVIGKSPASNIVENWNGTSWTAVSGLNTARQTTGASGTSIYGITYAGETGPGPSVAFTEFYDGTSWTELADLANNRYGVGSLGFSAPANLTVTWGGNISSTSTEEWTAPDVVINTLTTS